MTKHYILTLDPTAQQPWDRCILRDPITGERPDLTGLITEGVNNEPGSYLLAVQLDVNILEMNPTPTMKTVETAAIAYEKAGTTRPLLAKAS